MDEKYPAFVAFATLQAFVQLQELLAKWRVEPTPEILTDAGRYGLRRAMESMFPGLPKHPFAGDPQGDIEQGLRLYYIHAGSPGAAKDASATDAPSTRRERPAKPTALYVQAKKEESSHRVSQPSGVFRIPTATRLNDTAIRSRGDIDLSSPDGPVNDDPRRQAAMQAMASKLNPRRAGEESSAANRLPPPEGAAPAEPQRLSGTRLRPIERQAYPWTRKETDSVDEV